MDDSTIANTLSKHEARLDSLDANVGEIKDDVKKILEKISESRGSWKMITVLGGALVGVVEMIEAVKTAFIHK